VGESGSLGSGPGVRLSFALDAEFRITDARFETAAFPAARAAASALCRSLLGATLDQAAAVTIVDIATMGGISPKSVAARTVHYAKSAALVPVLGRAVREGPGLTCVCFRVPTERIREAIALHRLTTVDEVRARTRATSGCGTCRPDVERLLRETPPPRA